ncbi:MAG: RnfABCDGE type electron transport complex subunit A [Clostridiales bacterium]|nr:RnfABCDGE type electron transport complex subunit A [Clostridiales bacterium]
MKELAIILMSMVLVNNYVLVQFLGICPFLGVSKKLNSAVGMSIAVIFVMVLATAVTYPIQMLLDMWGIGYLQTVIFILVIAALVQLVEVAMKKMLPALHRSLGVYLPLITTNCAVLGVCIQVIDNGYNYLESIVCAAGAGLGFMLAMVLFSGVRQRIEDNDFPEAFKGIPITLVAASIVSMAFMGFSGVVDGIFGL